MWSKKYTTHWVVKLHLLQCYANMWVGKLSVSIPTPSAGFRENGKDALRYITYKRNKSFTGISSNRDTELRRFNDPKLRLLREHSRMTLQKVNYSVGQSRRTLNRFGGSCASASGPAEFPHRITSISSNTCSRAINFPSFLAPQIVAFGRFIGNRRLAVIDENSLL